MFALFRRVLFFGDGKLGPIHEDGTRGAPGTSHELGFDGPGERRPVVGAEDVVGAERVHVFCVDQETIHIEEAGADGGETGVVSMSVLIWDGTYSWSSLGLVSLVQLC